VGCPVGAVGTDVGWPVGRFVGCPDGLPVGSKLVNSWMNDDSDAVAVDLTAFQEFITIITVTMRAIKEELGNIIKLM
jgi:hypothetical protein